LIEAAGGISWATAEAQRLLDQALGELDAARLPHADAADQLREVAAFLVNRNW
jgi:geranylgeranyl pyrophosphate synthase